MTTEEKYEAKKTLQIAIQATTEQQIAYANLMGWTQMDEMSFGVFEHFTSWDVLYIDQKDFDYSYLWGDDTTRMINDFICMVRDENDKYGQFSGDLLTMPIGLPIERYIVAISLFLDKLIAHNNK